MLTEFGHLEAIPRDPAAWPKGVRGAARLAGNLFEAWQDAVLYRTLATLRTDVPLAETLDDLQWRGPDEVALRALCAEVEMPDFSDRVLHGDKKG